MNIRNENSHSAPDMKPEQVLAAALSLYRQELTDSYKKLTKSYIESRVFQILEKAGVQPPGKGTQPGRDRGGEK